MEDWEQIESFVKFDYAQDNYYEQQKQTIVLRDRMSTLQLVDPYVGRYFSNEWIRKNVLFQSQEEMEEMDEQIVAEQSNPLYQQGTDEQGDPTQGGQPPAGMTPQGPQPGGVSSVAPGDQNN